MKRSHLAAVQFRSDVKSERSSESGGLGWFIVCSVVVPGEGIDDVAVGPTKTLAILSDSVQQVVGRMEAGHFKSNRGLDWVLSLLDEI
jgi:hypothetical protein